MQAVILAAGRGTRLRPVTDHRTKAMVPVLGRPLVELALLPFYENGFRDFVFVVSPDDSDIVDFFSQRTSLALSVRFVCQEERLGMAHALQTAAPLVSEWFVLSACDSLIDGGHVAHLLEARVGAEGVLSLLEVGPDRLSKSAVVELHGEHIRRIVEKPAIEDAPSRTISLPHYIFSDRILNYLSGIAPSPRGEYELQDAIQALIDDGGNVKGVHADERLQVSTQQDLLTLTRKRLADGSEAPAVRPDDVGKGTSLIEPLRIEAGVTIGEGCEIGPEVYLESGCTIGRGAKVHRSIVLRGAQVDDHEVVEDRVVT